MRIGPQSLIENGYCRRSLDFFYDSYLIESETF